jgi:H+-transporting ATPase
MASIPDVERPDVRRSSRISRASLNQDWANLDEYGKLVKYVSTFRDANAEAQDEGDFVEKRVWYAPWKKRKVHIKKLEGESGKFPEEWTLTDIREGLSSEEIPRRRQRAGWNELSSERENPIAKVLSYFRGPILYGECLVFAC